MTCKYCPGEKTEEQMYFNNYSITARCNECMHDLTVRQFEERKERRTEWVKKFKKTKWSL